jgi:hypothetical protein
MCHHYKRQSLDIINEKIALHLKKHKNLPYTVFKVIDTNVLYIGNIMTCRGVA